MPGGPVSAVCGVGWKPASPQVAVDGIGKPGAVECRPYGRDGRLQVRVADGCNLREENLLDRGAIVSRQLPCYLGIVDLVVDEGIGQHRP